MSVHELARQIRTGQHIPDILDCLAQLSNDEVPTPPKLARAMLDILPDEVWSKIDYVWLDPFCKSGIFLREVAARLLEGLSEQIPDFNQRRDHIYRDMLWGTSITEMTGMISRRSLYYSRDGSGPVSVIKFDHSQGHLPYVRAEHTFPKKKDGTVTGGCTRCGAPLSLERGESRENYAYSFIHGAYPTEEMKNMKFDVIVGNPPYQAGDKKNEDDRAAPVYDRFVTQAIDMNPRYVVMVTPSRWFTGGWGLNEYRKRMLADRRLRVMVDNPKLFDCFPGVEIKGGVSYFLWDRNHNGDCEFSTRIEGVIRSTVTRDLREGDGVLMRDNRAAEIVHKVKERHEGRWVEDVCGPQMPFGHMRTNFSGDHPVKQPGDVALVLGSRGGYISPDVIDKNHDWVDQWKVLMPKAGDGHGREESFVLGEPIALAPGSACTQTYIVAGLFDTREETENYAHYLATKFVRFLVQPRKASQDIFDERFRFVPMLDMTRLWTDEDLYDRFDLTEDERAYIERTIKPRSVNLSLDSPIPASHLPGGAKYKPKGSDADE
ncbi:Eco57I restriction-modification methylase domain-containing protein [Nocardioides sp. LS1]|uniref:Eco57I restriction-modification methylase domain-containing protein n=1 Tax=Nocardioides sp. LS1 TaxID=1027620 RepID=UPI000F61AD2B|nr:Eco57I restriction-modification methylase domain-containing protein [Nocardioides sp. LS1]GCD88774.1 type III restriction endonuclease [Nocardioides sp. LS1]